MSHSIAAHTRFDRGKERRRERDWNLLFPGRKFPLLAYRAAPSSLAAGARLSILVTHSRSISTSVQERCVYGVVVHYHMPLLLLFCVHVYIVVAAAHIIVVTRAHVCVCIRSPRKTDRWVRGRRRGWIRQSLACVQVNAAIQRILR